MAYDEDLAERIRELTTATHGIVEKRMFGGLGFMLGGHLAVAAKRGGGLLARCDPAETDALVATTPAERAVMANRERDGWLQVSIDQLRTKRQLQLWIERALAYVDTLASP